MTDPLGGYPPQQQDPPTTPQRAKEEAAEVGQTAARGGEQAMRSVGEQTRRVAEEATQQARNLMQDGRQQLMDQAREGQRKAVQSLHTVADQFERMSSQGDDSGVGQQLVGQAAEHTRSVASWLEGRQPGDLVNEVRDFARRKPGVFLAGAALAGLLVGRLTRGVVASQSDDDSVDAGRNRGSGQPPVPQDYTPVPPQTAPGYQTPPAPSYSQPPPPQESVYAQQPVQQPAPVPPPGTVPPPWHGPGSVQP